MLRAASLVLLGLAHFSVANTLLSTVSLQVNTDMPIAWVATMSDPTATSFPISAPSDTMKIVAVTTMTTLPNEPTNAVEALISGLDDTPEKRQEPWGRAKCQDECKKKWLDIFCCIICSHES